MAFSECKVKDGEVEWSVDGGGLRVGRSDIKMLHIWKASYSGPMKRDPAGRDEPITVNRLGARHMRLQRSVRPLCYHDHVAGATCRCHVGPEDVVADPRLGGDASKRHHVAASFSIIMILLPKRVRILR